MFICRKCRHEQEYEYKIGYLNSLGQFDLGWLVGIIEGEGCFYKKSSVCKLRCGKYIYPLAGFALMSTDHDVMQRLSTLLQIKLKGPLYKQKSKERKVVWSLQVTGHNAIAIMKVLYKYMSKRRKKQIDDAIRWQNVGKFNS